MRRVFYSLLILFCLFLIAGYFFAKPLLLSLSQAQLKKIFKQSAISNLKITPAFIEFQDIGIRDGISYDLKIKEVRIYYNLRSIFDKKADFYIKDIKYNKLKIGDVTGKGVLKGNVLYINPMLVSFLGGNVKGEFKLSLDKDLNYDLRLNSHGMEIKKLVDDMEFTEKFDMTGRLEGEFYLSGKGAAIKDIKGNFYTDKNGGMLVIKDKTFLRNIAKQSNQSLDIIVESFRNYNYNTGVLELYINDGSLVLDIKLNGETGKRSLTIVLHEFKK